MRRLLAPIPIAVLCAIVALLALLAYGLASSDPDRDIDKAVAAGEREPAPDLELPPLSGGGERSLEDYRGKVVVLNFWASWCSPCREESPLLQRWHERIGRDNALVLGVNLLDITGRAKDFIDEYGLAFPMLRDVPGDTQSDFGIAQLPETFVIDRQGRIAAVQRGPVDDAFMREQVVPVLRERS